jgi:hypothetical protein
MIFLFFLLAGAFIFLFCSVIVLFSRTKRQEEDIRKLSSQLEKLLENRKPDSPVETPPETIPLAETAPPTEATPPERANRLTDAVVAFVRGGNLWAAGGVVLLTAGFATLITYVARRGFFTVEMGIAAPAAVGLFMILFGWRFRQKRPGYFLTLQGGGLGILYLSVYAAHKFTPYFSTPLSLALMTFLIPPMVILALFQNAQVLAVLAFIGGFATPLLLSGGNENHLFLFCYYLILNGGVLAIGYFRSWKGLNLAAFFFTFAVSLFWVIAKYKSEFFLSSEPFFLAYIITFTVLGLWSLKNQDYRFQHYSDIILILGTPAVASVIQWKIYSFIAHGYAIIALAFSVFYLLLATMIFKMSEKLSRHKHKDEAFQTETAKQNPLIWTIAIWGFAWWFGGWHYEFWRIFSEPGDAFLVFTSISAFIFWAIAAFFNLKFFIVGMVPAPISAAVTAIAVLSGGLFNYTSFSRPIFSYNFFDFSRSKGWAFFLLLQTISFFLLRPKTTDDIASKKYQTQEPEWFLDARLFIVILTALAVFGATARFYAIRLGLSESWLSLAGLLPIFAALVILPFSKRKLLFLVLPLMLSGVLGRWFIVSLFRPGDPSPLPFYLPVINLLDFLESICIFCILFWRMSIKEDVMPPKGKRAFFATGDVMAFLWVVSILARSVHNFVDLPWRRVFVSDEFQLCLLVFWALYGILHIVTGHRKKSRALWIAGAILVTADIAKLILFDMRGIGAVPRILSFFGAGLVLLFIGWAAPLPPAPEEK